MSILLITVYTHNTPYIENQHKHITDTCVEGEDDEKMQSVAFITRGSHFSF